jgi:hypothetical protein
MQRICMGRYGKCMAVCSDWRVETREVRSSIGVNLWDFSNRFASRVSIADSLGGFWSSSRDDVDFLIVFEIAGEES